MRYAFIIAFTALLIIYTAQYAKSRIALHNEALTASQWCFYAEYDTRQDWRSVTPPPHSFVAFVGPKVLVSVPCSEM